MLIILALFWFFLSFRFCVVSAGVSNNFFLNVSVCYKLKYLSCPSIINKLLYSLIRCKHFSDFQFFFVFNCWLSNFTEAILNSLQLSLKTVEIWNLLLFAFNFTLIY